MYINTLRKYDLRRILLNNINYYYYSYSIIIIIIPREKTSRIKFSHLKEAESEKFIKHQGSFQRNTYKVYFFFNNEVSNKKNCSPYFFDLFVRME